MTCKGMCSKYFIKQPELKKIGLYESGFKRCSSCEIYIKFDGKYCPCCNQVLRTRARNFSPRNKLTQKNIFKEFQLKLNLNQGIINYSKSLFNEIKEKSPFKYQSDPLTIGICIYFASRIMGQEKPIKKISEVFQIKESNIELGCEMALDEIKESLLSPKCK